MAKRLSVTSVIVMALMVVAATAAGPAPTGAEVLYEHVKKANAHLSSQMRALMSPAHPAARMFGAKQTSAQIQCITTCAQACVDRSNPCGSQCAQTCGQSCVQPCMSGSGAGSSGGSPPAPTSRCNAMSDSSPQVQDLKRQCGGFEFKSIFDLKNHSAAAHAEVNAFCSPSCIGPYNAFIRDYRECFPAETLEYIGILTSMCASDNGEYCAWRLRAVDQLTACDDSESRRSNTTCESNHTRNRYCKWDAKDRTCNVKPEVALLQQACTPCYDKWVFLIARMTSITADNSTEGREAVRLVQALVAIQKNYYCSKSNDVWCNPLVESLDQRVIKIEPSNNVSLDVIRTNVSNICTADGKVCVNKHAGAQVDLIREVTEATYRSCMRTAGNYYFPSTRQYYQAQCANSYRMTFQAVAQLNVDLSFMCRRNERDEACLPLAQQFVRHSCIATLNARPPVCNSTCATWVQNQTVTLGCCWDRFAELSFESQYPDTAVLPAPVAAMFPRAPAGGRNYTHNPGRPYVEACANTTGFNATAGREQVAAMCPVVAAVRKELTLVGVRWSRIESNATLKRAMEEALRSDMARSLGVAASAIVNGTLVADSSQSLTVGASANTSSAASASASVAASGAARRQQTAATSGTKFKFDLQLDSAAETTAAATRYETAKSSGQLQVTSTATVVSSQCADCVGSPTAAPGQTAAPPPTGNLFAAIVGSPTDGSSAGSSSTSGSAATTAVAAFVAAAAAVAAALA